MGREKMIYILLEKNYDNLKHEITDVSSDLDSITSRAEGFPDKEGIIECWVEKRFIGRIEVKDKNKVDLIEEISQFLLYENL